MSNLLECDYHTPLETVFLEYFLEEMERVTPVGDVTDRPLVLRLTADSVWSFGYREGKAFAENAEPGNALIQVTVDESDLRELLLGVVRDRAVEAMGGIQSVESQINLLPIQKLLLPSSDAETPHGGPEIL